MSLDETFVSAKAVELRMYILLYVTFAYEGVTTHRAGRYFFLACIIPILHNEGMKYRGIGLARSVHMIMIAVIGLGLF
jgi:hypothetical protein